MLKLKPVAPNEGVVLAALVTPKPVKELVVELEKEEAAAELAGTDIEGAVEAEDGVKPNEGTENEGCDVVVVVVVVVEAAGVEAVVVVIVENNGAAAELGFAADVVETEAAEEGVRNEKGDVVVAVDGDGVGFEKAEAVENESTEEDAVEFGANENEGAVVEAEEEEEEPAKRFEEAERNGDEVELAVDSDVANGDRDGVDPNRGEVVVAAVVEDPKRGEAAEGVVVADGVVPKRGEVVVVAVEAVRNGDGEVVDAAGGVEAELKGKEKEGVEDPNPREAGGAEEIGFAAVVVVVEEEEAKEKGEGEDPNGEAEDPNEKAEAVAVVEKEKGEGVDCEEVVVVAETEDPNGKPDMVSLSLTHSLLLWFWASDFGFGVLKK